MVACNTKLHDRDEVHAGYPKTSTANWFNHDLAGKPTWPPKFLNWFRKIPFPSSFFKSSKSTIRALNADLDPVDSMFHGTHKTQNYLCCKPLLVCNSLFVINPKGFSTLYTIWLCILLILGIPQIKIFKNNNKKQELSTQ